MKSSGISRLVTASIPLETPISKIPHQGQHQPLPEQTLQGIRDER
jgi:hypothetical protein